MNKFKISSTAWQYHKIRKKYQEKRHSQKWKIRKKNKRVQKELLRVVIEKRKKAVYRKHKAPENFSFINNTDDVLNYFDKAHKIFKNRENVEFDISQVEILTSDTIALLIASINSIHFTKHGMRKGNVPEKPALLKLFTQSGFGEHVSSSGFKKAGSGNLLHKEVNKKVVPQLAKRACITGLEHVFGNSEPFSPLYEILIECMSNTHNHANLIRQGDCRWWLYVYCDPDKKVTSYTFLDLGVGIFKSAVVQNYLTNFLKDIPWYPNIQLVDDLLEGKIHSRILKDQELRGKGIPQIVKHSKHESFQCFYIITNNVKIDLKSGKGISLAKDFGGTFFYWELANNHGN